MVSKAQKHKDKIIEFLKGIPNSTVDQWGNIRRDTTFGPAGKLKPATIRYKVKKSALRKEVKTEGSKTWNKLWSAYFKDLKLEVTDEKTKLIILKTM